MTQVICIVDSVDCIKEQLSCSVAVMSSSSVPSLRLWLESILLPQYHDVLTDSGYDTLHKCAVLTSGDLDRIGISLPGHKKRILTQLARFDLKPECKSSESAETTRDDPLEPAETPMDNSLTVTGYSSDLPSISEEHVLVSADIANSALVNLSQIF